MADFALASQKEEDAMKPGALTQAGVGLVVALYAWAVVLFFYIAQKWHLILPINERRSMVGFGAAIPFMVVRITYTVAFAATGDAKFSAVVGNPLVYLFMSMLMEYFVVAIIVWTIFGLPSEMKKEEPLEESCQLVDSSSSRA